MSTPPARSTDKNKKKAGTPAAKPPAGSKKSPEPAKPKAAANAKPAPASKPAAKGAPASSAAVKPKTTLEANKPPTKIIIPPPAKPSRKPQPITIKPKRPEMKKPPIDHAKAMAKLGGGEKPIIKQELPGKGAKGAEGAKSRYGVMSPAELEASKAAAAKLAAAAGMHSVKSTRRAAEVEQPDTPRLTKSPFAKKELMQFREVLLIKRRELVGDVKSMETEALLGGGGSLSHLPQHMADQGTDTFDQSLALDLAATQRGLLREIDQALERIDNGTFGICELSGRAIDKERLLHTPWARYSIEAARQLEGMNYQS